MERVTNGRQKDQISANCNSASGYIKSTSVTILTALRELKRVMHKYKYNLDYIWGGLSIAKGKNLYKCLK